jgi:Transposase DDE domain
MTQPFAHMDITEVFCDVDDFCKVFEPLLSGLLLPEVTGATLPKTRMTLSEVMTVLIGFHGSRYRTFKDYYLLLVLLYWKRAMPNLVSYNRFVELMSYALLGLCCYLQTCKGELTGFSFIDSTSLKVCHPKRATGHKVFADFATWGKNSIGWWYGFKLHLVINECGELLAFKVTPANVDDRAIVPDLVEGMVGRMFGDKGYISAQLFNQLYANGLKLVTRVRRNMKNQLVEMFDKQMLRHRGVIESVNDQLKHLCQIDHSRHRSVINFMVNLVAGLIAYTYHPEKPSVLWEPALL